MFRQQPAILLLSLALCLPAGMAQGHDDDHGAGGDPAGSGGISGGGPTPSASLGSSRGLAGMLTNFFVDGIRLQANGHEAHFLDQGNAAQIVSQLNAAIGTQFATSPLSSSSGAFTYSFDADLGTEVRASDSFGPIFAERALTLGKGNYNVGFNHSHYSFDSFEGLDLDGGDLSFTLLHEDSGTPGLLLPTFEGDLIDTTLRLDLVFDATTFFFNYGLADKFDLGIAVPFVQAQMDASFDSRIVAVATGSGIHQFEDGSLRQLSRTDGSASGVGDVVLRGKYRFADSTKSRWALGMDARIPTGDEEDLLGAGTELITGYVVLDGKGSRVSPHVNVSYSTSGSDSDVLGELPDELGYVAGFDAALSKSVTFAFDVIGRTIFDALRVAQGTQTLQYNANDAGTPIEVGTLFRDQLQPFTGDLSLLMSAIGFKYNVRRTFLLTANALVPLQSDRGLQDDLSVTLGIEYDF